MDRASPDAKPMENDSQEERPGQLDPERGRRLLAARVMAGLAQGAVAARLKVTRGTMRRWERGYWVSAASLAQLAACYGVQVAELQGAAETPAPVADTVREWPQWARERWAELQLELVRDGTGDDALTLLRSFVLSPHLLARALTEEQLRQDVEAGVAAARAWSAAHRQGTR